MQTTTVFRLTLNNIWQFHPKISYLFFTNISNWAESELSLDETNTLSGRTNWRFKEEAAVYSSWRNGLIPVRFSPFAKGEPHSLSRTTLVLLNRDKLSELPQATCFYTFLSEGFYFEKWTRSASPILYDFEAKSEMVEFNTLKFYWWSKRNLKDFSCWLGKTLQIPESWWTVILR